jgi:hypothetical protein
MGAPGGGLGFDRAFAGLPGQELPGSRSVLASSALAS